MIKIPNDIEAEQAVLGSIIEDSDLLAKVSNILKPETFYKPAHRSIYRAILELTHKQKQVDEVMLGDQLKTFNQLDESGGYAYLAELLECVPSSVNITQYAKILQEHEIMRSLIEFTQDIGRKASDPEQNVSELLECVQQKINDLSSIRASKQIIHIKDVFSKLFLKWEKQTENPDDLPGIPTQFIDLDRFTGGLIAPALWIIAARPKMGKTALVMNIVENVNTRSEIKGATLVVSLEMSKDQLGNRLLTSNAKVDNKKVKFGTIEGEDWDKLAQAVDRLSSTQINIDVDSKTINDVRSSAMRLNTEHPDGLGLIVVDYLQLMHGTKKANNREQEIAQISRGLKSLAMELNVPVIALSQLNRELEKRKDKRPVLSDLRESGAIEQDADVILFIYRDEIYYPNSKDAGKAEIIIGAHREGPTGTVHLDFIGKYTKFVNQSDHIRY